jgi:hypothetical protein
VVEDGFSEEQLEQKKNHRQAATGLDRTFAEKPDADCQK